MSSRRPPTITFMPRNRLSKILPTMNPKVFAECVENAEKEVERIAPILGESTEGDVQSLIRLCHQREDEIFGQCREIGWLALRIIESARLTRRPELAEAAKGLWEMIEALSERGVWHTDALRLHADALQALTSGAQIGADGIATIERELLRMRAAIGAEAAH
ncbi:MAG: hypothetical protein B7Y86_05120 [Brevundimonas subvibrioides]|uniref:Uncharacterized protein n=1 Tax=Brevundimonas subvibrioides TaxID=74313 RepID=A0A258HNC8_9CAUL|nr:hypothetical protein [Brevundimonas subvibrioides]OYX57852.1 MAG: hypothetical protein B7Y86_05120 [Brevundimonas subvibrioides]